MSLRSSLFSSLLRNSVTHHTSIFSLLFRHNTMKLHTRLKDLHLYVFARWVLDVLDQHRSITSIQGELLPFIVNAQHTRSGQGRYHLSYSPVFFRLLRSVVACFFSFPRSLLAQISPGTSLPFYSVYLPSSAFFHHVFRDPFAVVGIFVFFSPV